MSELGVEGGEQEEQLKGDYLEIYTQWNKTALGNAAFDELLLVQNAEKQFISEQAKRGFNAPFTGVRAHAWEGNPGSPEDGGGLIGLAKKVPGDDHDLYSYLVVTMAKFNVLKEAQEKQQALAHALFEQQDTAASDSMTEVEILDALDSLEQNSGFPWKKVLVALEMAASVAGFGYGADKVVDAAMTHHLGALTTSAKIIDYSSLGLGFVLFVVGALLYSSLATPSLKQVQAEHEHLEQQARGQSLLAEPESLN